MPSPIGTLRIAGAVPLVVGQHPAGLLARQIDAGAACRSRRAGSSFCSRVCPSRFSAIVIVPTLEECARISRRRPVLDRMRVRVLDRARHCGCRRTSCTVGHAEHGRARRDRALLQRAHERHELERRAGLVEVGDRAQAPLLGVAGAIARRAARRAPRPWRGCRPCACRARPRSTALACPLRAGRRRSPAARGAGCARRASAAPSCPAPARARAARAPSAGRRSVGR